MNTPTPLQSQERVAGLLAYALFLIPILMGAKTDFTMFHAKQSFMILMTIISTWFISMLFIWIPIIGWLFVFILWMMHILAVIIVVWCAYQAYLGNKFIIPYL